MRTGIVMLMMAAAAAAADPPSRYATLDGARVHYKSYGRGTQAVVFIHGWTCDYTFWRLQAPVYDKHRSLLIDLPGHGRSDKPEIAYTQPLFARGIDAVMRDAGVDRAVLVGHSMGGPVALTFLKLYPQKVAGVVLVDAFIPPRPKTEEEKQKGAAQFAQMINKMLRGPDYRDQVAKMIESMFSPAAPAGLKDDVKSKMLAAPQHVRLSAMEGMLALANESFPAAKVPTLAIREKKYVRPGEEESVRALFPQVDYVAWEGVGHFLMMEAPERFNATLEAFLAKLPHGGRL